METRSKTKNNLKIQDRMSRCSSSPEKSQSTCSSGSTPLDYTLHQVFLKFSNYLNVVHINAQSIPRHHLELLATFSRAHNIDAILVSETFLKSNMDTNRYSLPGFGLIRNDREGKPGGGIAIYLRQDIYFNYVTRSPKDYSNSAEHLFIEIFLGETKVLLGVYYCPSKYINYFPSFEGLTKHLSKEYDHVVILGDFNTCLLKNDKRSNTLRHILKCNSLHLPSLGPTHFLPKTEPSLLDLIIVSDPRKVMKHGQLTGCFSHHDILFVSYKVPSPKKNLYCNYVQPKPFSEPLWRTAPVIQALCKQIAAKRKLKRKRTQSFLSTYQMCRGEVKKYEDKHKRTFPRILISRRAIHKTKCHICEPRVKKKKVADT